MRNVGGLCVLLLLWSSPMEGREIFVDNLAGDDQFTGQQASATADLTGPVRTIGRALRLAQHGDAIVLAKNDVPYRESISLVGSRHGGRAGHPFIIRGNGAILDGSTPVPPEAWKHYRGKIFRFSPTRMGTQQLFLDDRPAARVPVAHSTTEPPELQPKQWCWIAGRIYFCVEKTKLPDDYRLSCADESIGVTMFHVDHVVVEKLTVQGFQLDGISLHNSARNVSLQEVTCRGNGRSGVAVGGASMVDLDNSLLGNNGRAQLLTLPYSETHLHGTHLLSNTAPAWVDEGGRVYLDNRRIEGGMDQFQPDDEQEKKP